MTTSLLQYSATLVTPTGASYTYSGETSLASLTPGAFLAAASFAGSDIGNQMVNGTPTDAAVLSQQATDQTSD